MACNHTQCFHPDCWDKDGCCMDRMKPLATNPELLKKLVDCKTIWASMTNEQRAVMLRLQSESWVRQDMD
jgi:hypothetical protein